MYTSYLDLKTREVADHIWLIGGGLALAWQVYQQLVVESTDFVSLILAVGIAAGAGAGGYYGGFFGGADAKALVVAALALPTYDPRVGIHQLAPLMILANGIILTLVLPIYQFMRNLLALSRGSPLFSGFERESRWRKLAALFLGYRTGSRVSSNFLFSIEELAPEGKRFTFRMLRADDDFISTPYTWVTPGIPLLVYLTAGYVVMLGYGDLLSGFLRWVYGR